jgi:hypothetical protein
MATAGDTKQRLPIFRWETLTVIGPHVLGFRPPVPGIMMQVMLMSGTTVRVWRSADARQYFCHGLTFGGKDAPGGPVSPYTGAPVETILREHYTSVPEAEARAGDILIWRGVEPETTPHSAVLSEVVRLPGRDELHEPSRLLSKNGMLPEDVFTLEELWAIYGESYRVYRQAGVEPAGKESAP